MKTPNARTIAAMNEGRWRFTASWDLINTAPQDGTWVLLTGGQPSREWCIEDKPTAVVGHWTNMLNDRKVPHGRWHFAWYEGGFDGEYENPTHWMPLPKPPEE